MMDEISRRDLLKTGLAANTALLISGSPQSPAATSDRILPLTSSTDVYVPPRGESFFKFSFDFPEPSVAFQNLLFSFRVYSFENTYALDRSRMTVRDTSDGIEIGCSQFLWGGDQTASGSLRAVVHKNGDWIEWTVSAQMDRPIKSIASIVRGVPRGRISIAAHDFFDPKDNEVLHGSPYLFGSMTTPLAVIEKGENDYFFLSLLHERVRASRFYFQPGDKGYRVELVYEREGWQHSNRIETPIWRTGNAARVNAAMRPHFEHLEKAYNIGDWGTRADVPEWCRDLALAIALHGMHWTGYIFNDFAKMQQILAWVATQIPANRVLVFLPAWDGRYYWNYPIYKVEPRLGGDDGFRGLIESGHRLGFRFLPMFGTNAANRRLPVFSKFADATTQHVDGDPFDLNWVDWDNDRSMEGWSSYMNLGVDSWRQWLFERIDSMIRQFHVDAYFLDIVGGWMNNTKADMHEGTVRLVRDLREKHPNVLAVGEMPYDALMCCIPVFQVPGPSLYKPAFLKYCRSFQHLSHPAPGRGSTGVHEAGFGKFHPALPPAPTIPTITVVDDTFDKYRDEMTRVITDAKQRAGIA